MAGTEAETEALLRTRLVDKSSLSLVRPSVNVAVCAVRAVEDDLDPPRGLWADYVFVANDAGVVAVVQERDDEGRDRLEVLDLLARDPRARSAVGDDAWVRAFVRRHLKEGGAGQGRTAPGA